VKLEIRFGKINQSIDFDAVQPMSLRCLTSTEEREGGSERGILTTRLRNEEEEEEERNKIINKPL